jgi:hypothetical protein
VRVGFAAPLRVRSTLALLLWGRVCFLHLQLSTGED